MNMRPALTPRGSQLRPADSGIYQKIKSPEVKNGQLPPLRRNKMKGSPSGTINEKKVRIILPGINPEEKTCDTRNLSEQHTPVYMDYNSLPGAMARSLDDIRVPHPLLPMITLDCRKSLEIDAFLKDTLDDDEYKAKTVKQKQAFLQETETKVCHLFHRACMKNDPIKQAMALQQLGDLYILKAKLSRSSDDIIHSATLFNAAFSRSTHQKQRKCLLIKIIETEKLFMNLILGLPYDMILKVFDPEDSPHNRQLVSGIRKNAFRKWCGIREMWTRLLAIPRKTVTVEALSLEGNIILETKRLSAKVKQDITDMIRNIATTCIEILPDLQYQFAIIGFGNIATELMTPYQDLEFLFLVENGVEDCNDLNSLLKFLQLKIVNLGETPLHASMVQLVNYVYNTDMNAFFDPFTPNGIKVSKKFVQFIKNRNSDKPLQICSIQDFVDMILEETQDPVNEEYSFKLFHPTLLYGDSSILEEFEQTLMERVKEGELPLENKIVTCELKQIFHDIDINPKLLKSADSLGHHLNLMYKDLFALSDILSSLRVLYHIPAAPMWSVIETMCQEKLVSNTCAQNIRFAIAIAYCIRLNMHFACDGQNIQCGFLQCLPQKADDEINQTPNVLLHFLRLEIKEGEMVEKLYGITLAVVDLIKKQVTSGEDISLQETDLTCTQKPFVKAMCHYRMLNFRQALDDMKKEHGSWDRKCRNGTTIFPEFQVEFLSKMGLLALKLGYLKEANEYFTNAMVKKDDIQNHEYKISAFVKIWFNFGLGHLCAGKYSKAESFFNEVDDLYHELTDGGTNREVSAMACEGLGKLEWIRGNYVKAIEHLETALSFQTDEEGGDQFKYIRSDLLTDIACLYLNVANYKEAIQYLRQSLVLSQALSDSNRADIESAMIFRHIGLLLDNLGKPFLASLYKYHALSMATFTMGNNVQNHEKFSADGKALNPGIISTMVELGCNYYYNGIYGVASVFYGIAHDHQRLIIGDSGNRYKLAAIEFNQALTSRCQQCYGRAIKFTNTTLETLKDLFGADVHSIQEIKCLGVLGNIACEQNEFEKALGYLRDAQTQISSCDFNCKPQLLEFLEEIANVYIKQSNFDQALEYLKQTDELKRSFLTPLHPSVAYTLRDIGLVYAMKENFQEAITNLKRAKTILIKVIGNKLPDPDLADVLFHLGQQYANVGCKDDAAKYLSHCLEIRKDLNYWEPTHPDVIYATVAFGHFYRNIGDIEKAKNMLEDTLESCSGYKGHEAAMAEFSAFLAKDYSDLTQPWKAIEMLDLALELQGRTMGGSNSSETAQWLGELGRLYDSVDENEKAANCYAKAKVLRNDITTRNPPEKGLVAILNQVADSLESMGQMKEAIILRKQSHERQKQLFGDEVPHYDTASILGSIGGAHLKLGEHDKGIVYFRKQLDMLAFLNKGTPSKDVSNCLQFYGKCYEGLGNYSKALVKYDEAYEILEKVNARDDSEDKAMCLTNKGYAINAIGDSKDAIEILTIATNIFKKLHKNTKTNTNAAYALRNLASAYEGAGNFDKALEKHKEALQLRKGLSGEEVDDSIAESLRAVGRVNCFLGNFQEGLEQLRQGLAMVQEINDGKVTIDIAQSLLELGQGYAYSNNPSQGLLYLNHALHVMKSIFGERKPNLHVAKCLSDIALTYRMCQNSDKAILHAEEAIQIYLQILPLMTDHPTIATMTMLIGDTHFENNRFEQSLPYYKKASQMYLSLHSGNHLHSDVLGAMKKMEVAQNK